MDFLHFLISWQYWKLELIDSVLKLIKLYQASELILDFGIFSNKVISSFGINFGFLDFSWNFGYVLLIWTTILDNSGLKLLLYGPQIRINQSHPGNIGSYDPYSVLSWKYWIVRSILSSILEIVDRTIHTQFYSEVRNKSKDLVSRSLRLLSLPAYSLHFHCVLQHSSNT